MTRGPLGIRRAVCPTCPFRGSGQGVALAWSLDPARRAGIVASLRAGESFVCHEESHAEMFPGVDVGAAGPRQCAGAAIVMARAGESNQVMQIALRFGEPPFIDPGDRVVPWRSLDAWVQLPG